jgi:uncharacterized protein involved in outer membrane biogenesis
MYLARKLLLWMVAVTGALLAGIIALLLLVDVNLYRDRIEQHVSNAFGRKVILEGELGLEPSLTPRFVVNGIRIANPDWASRPHLATVDKFDIRVGLLPLLQGELKILSLEFHGVDLLLEKNASGENNFTFDSTGEPAALPAIDHFRLSDTTVAYAETGAPVRRLPLSELTARKLPDRSVELSARTTVKSVPVTLSLQTGPEDGDQPDGPWQLALNSRAGDLSLQLAGSMTRPADWRSGEYRLVLEGRHLHDLEALTGYSLPGAEPAALDTRIRFRADESVLFEEITGLMGSSDVRGNLDWRFSGTRPVLRARLESRELYTADLVTETSTGEAERTEKSALDESPDISALAGIDLDVDIRVHRLVTADRTIGDINLSAHAGEDQLMLDLDNASVDKIRLSASATLPWGNQLTEQAQGQVTPASLLQHARVDARVAATDSIYRYSTDLMGQPLGIALTSLQATARAGEAIEFSASATLNDRPVNATLRGESLASLLLNPEGPWQNLALEVRGDVLRIDATGSVSQPLQLEGFDVSYTLGGRNIGDLLPLQGSWSASGHYTSQQAGRHLFDDLQLSLGRSDLRGRVALHKAAPRSRLIASLGSDRLHIDDFRQQGSPETTLSGQLDQPLDIGGLTALDLDIEARVRHLDGLEEPVQDVVLTATAGPERLTLAQATAVVGKVPLEIEASLPWGDHLRTRTRGETSPLQLLERADLALQARLPAGRLQQEIIFMGHTLEVELAGFRATASPATPLQISAAATIDDTAVRGSLQAEALATLLQHPEGPWQDLELEIAGSDIQLQAQGSVEHPLEGRGFDIRYSLHGDRVESILPVLDFVLPLEGAYSLTGRFTDLPDRRIFDNLNIITGNTDISGTISIYEGKLRPRVVANFQSEQIYLTELLPVSDAEQAVGAKPRIIPDYNLPIERFRDIDGEIYFRGNRLRTEVGDLGEINFTATLKDGVFRLDPFRVRGWAGAMVESTMTIDASREPPDIDWQWIARELNYGVLLQQAGLAETVEGTLDVSLRLAGQGRTRYEFLGNADGQLVVVGEQGRFGSRRLDLWGSSLITTMLSPEWRREDVTDINCLVARVNIVDGLAASDDLLIDTRRITIGAAGTLDLESEELNLIFAPRPKRATLIGITNPAHLTGTLAEPRVAVTVLPRNRMAAAGGGLLAGLINPAYLLFAFTQTGSGVSNPCTAAVNEALIMKGRADEIDGPDAEPPPARFALFPGCARAGQRRE